MNQCFRKHNMMSVTLQNVVRLCQLFKKEKYSESNLRDELCKIYNQNDTNSIICGILMNELNLKNEKQRQQIYDILIHEYFNVKDLTINNIIDISKTFIKELNLKN
eukprot:349054_1